jgi:hypothetical protein
MTPSAHRLIRWGLTERQAQALASYVAVNASTEDSVVEDAVIRALCRIKESVSGHVEVELICGQRRDKVCDTLRLR